jgi:hypothetical protein
MSAMNRNNRSSSQALLERARALLVEAARCAAPQDRFLSAHLAALRTAAAVLAAQPGPAPRRPTSAWTLLSAAEPAFARWAAEFAAGARTRGLIEAGIGDAVTMIDANVELQAAVDFLAEAEDHLGFAPVLLAG